MPRLESVSRVPSVGGIVLLTWVAWVVEAEAQDPSDPIYEESRVATFTLTLNATDWNAICNDGAGAGDQWKRATMTWQPPGGPVETVDGVGVKRSGKGTLPMDTPKPSIRISFNEFEFANPAGPGTPGRKWRDVNRIKLDSMIGNTDPALMRDRIAYGLFRQMGAPAPRACHARLYVNGTFKGLYIVEEPIRKDFVRYRWSEDSGNLYNMFAGWANSYVWRGADPTQYVPSPFYPETNYPGGDYRDIVEVCSTLNNFAAGQIRTRLEGQINVDGFLRHLALDHVLGNHDSIHSGNNYYWYYRVGTNRLEIIKWDPGASQGLYDLVFPGTGGAETSYPFQSNWANLPELRWIQNDAVANTTFKVKIIQILDGPASQSNIHARIDSVYNQIKSHAYEDPLKGQSTDDPGGFTNAEFDAAVTWLKNWFPRREAYLRGVIGNVPTTPTVTITASDASAGEPSNTGSFSVARTGSTAASLTVNYGIGGTATNGTDYNSVATSVTIPAGAASAAVTVTPRDDTAQESNETVILTLSSNASYTVGSPSSATVTIADNDAPATLPVVTVTASDPSAGEPSNAGAFTVSRMGATTASLAVSYTVGGTATPGTDYTALSGSVTIPAGAASAAVTVIPRDDTAPESGETVVVTLSAGGSYTVGTPSSATVTIADNDSGTTPTQITAPAPGTPFRPGQSVTATGTGANLSWSINRVGDGQPAFASGTGSTITFTVPADSTGAHSIQITLTGGGGVDEQTHPIEASPSVTASFQDGTSGYAGTRDTYLSQSSLSTNFGSDVSVRADGDEVGGQDLVGLLKFDLTSIPAGSSIQGAELTLTVTNPTAGGYELYEAKRPWMEGEATWQGYASGQAWQSGGAQGAQDRGAVLLGTLSPASLGTYTLTFTAAGVVAVQGWVDAPGTNHGVVIANAANADGMAFESRQSGTAANRPKLTVTYGPGTAPVDTDGDGMTDVAEVAAGFNPNSADQDQNGTVDGQDDWDGDGIINQTEIASGTPAGSPPGGGAAGAGGDGGCGATGLEAALLLAFLGATRAGRKGR